ncbi:BspA family leucine-rich repeat surface protein [Croceitalea vernalis]|uniref:BspA family leucine-rich repeat surface protein n=1 Tax=Croceitalea vernalis TaxID=3075599 RepID=A0ABU3BKC8_9FLAO|nr:BspA family leucine-rich repeat surface protein [Croceitalea sp. P007]MDT0622607.1 BspA family leucine-rich repeat surface protein [Croceitalea sp. P007]
MKRTTFFAVLLSLFVCNQILYSQDVIPPSLVSLTPNNNTIDVPLASDVILTFDEVVQLGNSPNPSLFLRNETNNRVEVNRFLANITIAGNIVTINPDRNLYPNKEYTFFFSAGFFEDLSGNPVNEYDGPNEPFSFFTVTTTDVTEPSLVSIVPEDNSIDVPVDTNISLTFNENISIQQDPGFFRLFRLEGTGTPTPQDVISLEDLGPNSAGVIINNNSVELSFNTDLQPNTRYLIQVVGRETLFQDDAGNPWGAEEAAFESPDLANLGYIFTTADGIADIPTTAIFNPISTSTSVPADQVFTVQFNEILQITDDNLSVSLLEPSSFGGAAFYESMSIANGGLSLSDDGVVSTLIITPSQPMPFNKSLTISIPTGLLEDLSGNAWQGTEANNGLEWQFSTEFGDTSCVSGDLDLEITFDNFAEETSWEIINGDGSAIVDSASYTNNESNTTITDQITGLADGLYTFRFLDVFGDGICCSQGFGNFKVSKNDIVLFEGGQFLTQQSFIICINSNVDSEIPVITSCASDTTVDAGASCSSSVSVGLPTATDNVSTNFTFEGIRADGFELTDPYFVGTTAITWTATDEAGNVSESCNQIITVNGAGDCWFDIGPELSGTSESSLGSGVSINGDGNIIAYMVPNANGNGSDGNAIVLENTNGIWNQLGTPIPAGFGFGRGFSGIDLNDSGNRVSVSKQSGNVQVYEFNNGVWSALGVEIPAAGQPFIQKVDFDASGDRLAVGYAGENESRGRVVVYELQSGSWLEIGGILNGDTSGDSFGRDVSLSADGTILAVGAYQIGFNSIPQDLGYVRTFQLENGVWTQIGEDINGENQSDFFGVSCSLNAQGNRLIIGANAAGYAKVYGFNNGIWSQLGSNLVNNTNEQAGYHVDINEVGDIVLVGNFSQPARIFQWNGATWNLLGQPIYAEVGQDVAINKNGNTVVLGAPEANGLKGKVSIFEYSGVLDSEAPVITCSDNIEVVIGNTDTTANVVLTNPTATDNISTSFTFQGVRSDALALTDPYPLGVTTITWTATDQAGNVSTSCDQTVSVFEAESEAEVVDGELDVKDCTNDTDDTYDIAVEDGFLILSNNAPIIVSGDGVEQRDANTVAIPLDGLTTVTINGGNGSDTLTLPAGLDLNTLGIDLVTDNIDILLSGTGTLNLANLSVNNGNFETNADVTVNVGVEANFFADATLSGNGTISGVVNMNVDSNLFPGTSPGILNTGDLTLDNSNNNFEVNGLTPGTEHDQVVVTGSVTIVAGTSLNLLGGYANGDGDEIILITNDGTDAITGTFNGLAEGEEVVFGDFTGTISYVGGDGNDLVLNGTVPAVELPFITEWITRGTNDEIVIPTNPIYTYDYTVDWGDGTIENNVTGDGVHTYAAAGTYQVKVSGAFPAIYFNNDRGSNIEKILGVAQWGTISWSSMENAFAGVERLTVDTPDVPDLSNVTSLSGMFSDIKFSLLFRVSLNGWDVSNVTDMSRIFKGTGGTVNVEVSSWDVSNVTDMSEMFSDTGSFNDDLSGWDVSSVTNMSGMFNGADSFDADISGWDVSKVTDMGDMFRGARSFNVDISGWDVSNVTDMGGMFFSAADFNVDISVWDVSKVTDMSFMFVSASDFNQDIGVWATTSLTDASRMFSSANSFDQNLGGWDVSKVTDAQGMFEGIALSTANYDALLTGWSQQMLQNGVIFGGGDSVFCTAAIDKQSIIDIYAWVISDGGSCVVDSDSFITEWITRGTNDEIVIPTNPIYTYDYTVDWGDGTIENNVTGDGVHTYAAAGTYQVKVSGAFPAIYFNNDRGSNIEKILGVAQWGTISWSSMENAFAGVERLTVDTPDVPDLSNVTSLSGMFSDIKFSLLFRVSLNGWDVSNVTDMSRIFKGTGGTVNVEVSSWDVSNVTDMSEMFSDTGSFNDDLSGWDVSSVTNMSGMFNGADSFDADISGWDVSKVTDMGDMFRGARSFNVDISGWDVSNVTDMGGMFFSAADFNVDISVWDVSKVTDMSFMFVSASDFNQDIGVWATTSLTDASRMFSSANSFDQNLGGWDVSKVTDAQGMFEGIALSTANYDALLTGWSQQMLQNGVIFGGGDSVFCTAAIDKQSIIDIYAWVISDGGSCVVDSDSFITEWITRGTNDEIVIPTNPIYTYDYTVDWGDGTIENNVTGDGVHTYAAAGTYQVKVSGAFPAIYFNNDRGSNIEKILGVAQWGTISWSSMENAFAGVERLTVDTPDVPDLSNVTSLSGMFSDIKFSLLFRVSLNGWDVSNVTDMSRIFKGTGGTVNVEVSSWDVSNVTDMSEMFSDTGSFNDDLSGWDVSSVTNMSGMFNGADSFDADISGWDVSKVTDMGDMFRGARSFNVDISGWDVSNVTDMGGMFFSAADFNVDISVWDVSKVTDMSFMFVSASDFNQDIGVWATTSLTDASRMFSSANSFDQNLGGWDVSKVTDAQGMFEGIALSTANYDALLTGWSQQMLQNGVIFGGGDSVFCTAAIDKQSIIDIYAWVISDGGSCVVDSDSFITEWITRGTNDEIVIPTNPIYTYDYTVDWGDGTIENNVTGDGVHTYAAAGTYQVKVSGAFPAIYFNNDRGSNIEKILGVAQWGTISWSSMENAFAGVERLTVDTPDVPDLSNVTSLSGMFSDIKFSLLFRVSLNGWDVSNVTDMSRIFKGTGGTVNVEVSSWDVSNVTDMSEMFSDTGSFNDDLSGWDVSSVTNMSGMFNGADSFDADISGWDVSKVTDMGDMFRGARSFNVDISGWDVSNVTDMGGMFFSAADFNVDISVWDVSKVTDMSFMFVSASDFNQDIGVWATTSLTDASRMFSSANSFDQNLGGWDVSKVTDAQGMFEGIALSTANYDALLTGWSQQTLQNGVVFGGGESEYCDGVDGIQILRNDNNWIVSDFGILPEGSLDNNGVAIADSCGTTDDSFALSASAGNLVINNSGSELKVSGDQVAQQDENTVAIPINEVTTGLEIDGGEGDNSMTIDSSFDLVGENNGLTLSNLDVALDGNDDLELNALEVTEGDFNTSGVITVVDTEANFNTGASLSGDGSLTGDVNMNPGSTLNAGNSPGVLNTGNLTLDNNNNEFEVNGSTPSTDHDQVMVTGTVTIIPGTTLNLLGGYLNGNGDQIILIANDGTDAINGTFDGLAEGDEVVFGDFIGSISYVSGDGNDLVLNGVQGLIPGAFVTTWQTTTANESITIPTTGSGYNYSVDWGDGNIDANQTGDTTHSYATAGTHTVSITGDFPRIYFNNAGDKDKILTVNQWGEIEWVNMQLAFYGCSNLDVKANDVPDFSGVISLANMFLNCTALVGTGDFNNWNTSNIENFNGMFFGASLFNQVIEDWDTSAAKEMFGMFQNAIAFNQELNTWNVSNVSNMNSMFSRASSFNGNISDWDTSSLESTIRMFFGAREFNQDISSWDLSKVVNMELMFNDALKFNQDVGDWDVSSVENMFGMFWNAQAFNQDLSQWDISSIIQNSSFDGMAFMFSQTQLSLQNYDNTLSGWATFSVGNGETQIPLNITFDGGSSQYCLSETARQNLIDNFGWTITDGGLNCPIDFTDAFITTWKTDNVDSPISTGPNQLEIQFNGTPFDVDWGDGTIETIISGVAEHTYALPGTYMVKVKGTLNEIDFSKDKEKLLEINQWGSEKWKFMRRTFRGCINLDVTAEDVPDFSELQDFDLDGLFENCESLIGNESFNNWDVSSIDFMSNMFRGAILFNQDLNNWDVSNVSSMDGMFRNATAFNGNISNWEPSKVVVMADMFSNASSFNGDLNGWDVNEAEDMSNMFRLASSFNQNIGDWNISNLVRANNMFTNVELSIENYDALLSGWSTLDIGETTVPNNINFSGGNSQYCDGEPGRTILEGLGWTITDGGEFCNDIPPTITCPEAIEVNQDSGVCEAIVILLDPTATDDVSLPENIIFEGTRSDGLLLSDAFPVGETTISWTATDEVGNISEPCEQVITVIDNVPPTISCPETIEVTINSGTEVNVDLILPTGFDLCSGIDGTTAVGTFGSDRSDGRPITDSFPIGETIITWTAADEAVPNLNSSEPCQQIVRVVLEDVMAPEITCPDDVTMANDVGLCAASFPIIPATATDNISAPENITITGVRGDSEVLLLTDPFPVGETTITWTATDETGKASSCEQLITINDTEPPTAVCQDITVQLDASGNASITAADIDGGSTDNCGIASLAVGPSSFSTSNVGVNTVTLTVTDTSGNSATCTANVTVEDNVAPNAVCQSITVQLDGNGSASISASDVDGGSTDAAGITSISVSPSTFSCSDIGANTVTLTVTDVNSNFSTCTATVTVEDNIAPTITCPSNIMRTSSTALGLTVVDIGTPITDDNCGVASVVGTRSDNNSTDLFSDPYQQGTTTITYVVTDDNGLKNTCIQTITISSPSTTSVPGVVGLPQATAESNIIAANLTVGTITTANDALVPSGNIISQNPSGGASAFESSPVDLIVSLGPLCAVSIETQPEDVSKCQFDSTATPISVLASGNGTLSYFWEALLPGSSSWAEVVPSANGSPQLTFNAVDILASGTQYRVVVTSDNGTPGDDTDDCSVTSDAATLTVNPMPTVSFTALADLCIDSGVQTGLGGATPTGGVYSGPGVTDDGNGMTYSFYPAVAGVGVHTITYDFINSNGCLGSASDDVEVFALPVVIFTAPADLQVDAGVQSGLGGGTPTGGVYSGPGVTDDGNGMTYSFDPAVAGVGTHTITYTYTNGNGCSDSASDDVQILPVQPEISIGDVSQLEGTGGTTNMNFMVSLSAATTQTITVDYSTIDDTAVAPEDYTAVSTTILTFSPGEINKTITVDINPDSDFELDEMFTIVLEDPVNATIAVNEGTGTIENDDVEGCSAPSNVALNKPSSQSSTYGNGIASFANDGNLSGSSPWDADLQHTSDDTTGPWWEVDLGSDHDLEEVVIYNRTNGFQDRLSDFYVFVSDAPFSSSATASDLVGDASVWNYYFEGSAGALETIPSDINGRYVRIQLGAQGFLHMAELEVMGCPSGPDVCDGAEPVMITAAGPFLDSGAPEQLVASPAGGTWSGQISATGLFDPSIGAGDYIITYSYTNGDGCTQSDTVTINVMPDSDEPEPCEGTDNVALNKPASQSSTYGNGEAFYANDGNLEGGSPWSADLQHTVSGEAQPWWEVDLGSAHELTEVKIYNRTNRLQSRLNNFYIFVSDSPFSGSLLDQLGDPNIESIFFEGEAGLVESFSTMASGRYVRVQLQGSGTLHMAEVEVYGCPTDPSICDGSLPVTITPAGPFLDTEGEQQLTANPEGGTWSGAVSSSGLFDPSALGAGSYEVGYTFTNENGCTKSDTVTIVVNEEGGTAPCTEAYNLALDGTASHSSTYGNGEAFYANDGNQSGSSPWSADLQHTLDEDSQPWWQVDLGEMATIERVVIYNRTDKLQSRLNNFYVLYSDSPFGTQSLDELLADTAIGREFFSGAAGLEEEFTVDVMARYVRVQKTGSGPLHMAEVEVYGCPFAAPPLQANLNTFNVWPNPASEDAKASFENPTNVLSLMIYDMQGRIVKVYEPSELNAGMVMDLNVNTLAPGLYIIRTEDERGIHFEKQLVIKR